MSARDRRQDAVSNGGRMDRRHFMRLGGAGVGLALGGTGLHETRGGDRARPPGRLAGAPQAFPAAPSIETVRIGFVGVGGMGTAHVQNLVTLRGAVITAVADIREEHAQRAADIITAAGHRAPTLYTRGERDFERMCAEEDLDLVYNATPWQWHVPIGLTAMENGKHARRFPRLHPRRLEDVALGGILRLRPDGRRRHACIAPAADQSLRLTVHDGRCRRGAA